MARWLVTSRDLPPPRPFTRADADEFRSHGTWLGDSIADAIDARLDAEQQTPEVAA